MQYIRHLEQYGAQVVHGRQHFSVSDNTVRAAEALQYLFEFLLKVDFHDLLGSL